MDMAGDATEKKDLEKLRRYTRGRNRTFCPMAVEVRRCDAVNTTFYHSRVE